MKRGKPSLIEQSHNTWLAILRAKRRGDKKEVTRLNKLKEYLAEQIRKGKA